VRIRPLQPNFGVYLMIAIDVIMTTKDKTSFDVLQDVLPLVTQSRENIYNFFKNCIDQNLVLNATYDIVNEALTENKTRYFSSTVENAQAFQNAFTDMSADFSMKKMWDEHGFDIYVEQHEVDFDKEYDVYDLISPDGDIWSTEF
jgi:hypothetical protein